MAEDRKIRRDRAAQKSSTAAMVPADQRAAVYGVLKGILAWARRRASHGSIDWSTSSLRTKR
jgi:hypothetical protein